jgi:hypothetical protein
MEKNGVTIDQDILELMIEDLMEHKGFPYDWAYESIMNTDFNFLKEEAEYQKRMWR